MGYTPGPPLKGGREGRGEGEERKGAREGSPPQFTFLATPLTKPYKIEYSKTRF